MRYEGSPPKARANFSITPRPMPDVSPPPEGSYDIFGNQEEMCPTFFDFTLRPGHPISVEVGASGDANVRIGLTFGTNERLVAFPEAHAPGPTKLWLTIIGEGLVLRSSAVEVEIKGHTKLGPRRG